MTKRKFPETEFKCKTCGYIPTPDKSQSNKNWKVIDATCPKCGGRISPSIGTSDRTGEQNV